MKVEPIRAASLWLPLRQPRLAWIGAALIAGLGVLGMARDLGFYDSGELAVAAVQLGLSHPPGQPLYTLLGFAFSKLVPGAPLVGLNLLSVCAAALSVFPILSLAERMHDVDAPATRSAPWVTLLALVLGSQHAALWEQASRIEVYALAVFLALWALAFGAFLLDGPRLERRGWLGLGLALGACAAVNPVLALLAALAGAPGLIYALRARTLGLLQVSLLVLGGVLGLLPYLYVPLVAGRQDALVWGAPSSAAALTDYLGGRDYRSNLSVSGWVWLQQMGSWVAFSLEFALLPLWGVGLVAHTLAPPRGLTRALAPVLCVSSVAYLARYTKFIPEVPDYVSYTSLATWVCLAGVAALIGSLWARRMWVGAVSLFGVLLASVVVAPPPLLARTRAHDVTARAITRALLDGAPRGAVIVVGADHWVAPLWYLQEVEHQRPDVVVLVSGLLSSSWYFEHVFRRHPDFARASLQGPGGRQGRLARLLAANPTRPVLFEELAEARALGFPICAHRVFGAARSVCDASPEATLEAAQLWASLRAKIGEGEPTSLGVLASISLQRGLLLAQTGAPAAALRTLLAPLDPAAIDTTDLVLPSTAAGTRLEVPAWSRDVPLGDPARNVYLAAQLMLAAGQPERAVVLMLAASELGLPEADDWLARVAKLAAQP